jgi:hypothetical protein
MQNQSENGSQICNDYIYVTIFKYENIGHCFNIIPLWIQGPNMTFILYANHTLMLGQIVKRSHTLVASTLIRLFSEMSRFSKKYFFQKKNFVKEIKTIFKNNLEIF